MADGRMLKKAICTSRKLAELKTDTARLLYTWLLPHLDIEGRFSGDPDVIKGYVFPRVKTITAERIKVCLIDMVKCELIKLYTVNGDDFLEFTKFSEFQHLRSDREAKSTIPPPECGELRDNSGSTPAQDKIREDKISLREVKLREGEKQPRIKLLNDIVETYHARLPTLPGVIKISDTLSKHLLARIKEDPERESLEWWFKYFDYIKDSDFLMGRIKEWSASFHWIIGKENMSKILAGAYNPTKGKMLSPSEMAAIEALRMFHERTEIEEAVNG